MEKTYLLALVRDDCDKYDVLNSKENGIFFENRRRGMNYAYTIVFGILTVSEENYENALNELNAIDTKSLTKSEIREKVRIAYINYDYKFRYVEDKTDIFKTYDH